MSYTFKIILVYYLLIYKKLIKMFIILIHLGQMLKKC